MSQADILRELIEAKDTIAALRAELAQMTATKDALLCAYDDRDAAYSERDAARAQAERYRAALEAERALHVEERVTESVLEMYGGVGIEGSCCSYCADHAIAGGDQEWPCEIARRIDAALAESAATHDAAQKGEASE